jgi:SAM-dependent methyltransferase
MRRCRICGAAVGPSLAALYDDRYGYPDTFTLEACAACGHQQLDAEFSSDALSRLYSEYYPRKGLSADDYSAYPPAQGFTSWLNGERCSAYHWVPPRVRVLDIGCGTCGTLGYHRARGCDVYGVEPDANVKAIAERHGFEVHIGLFEPGLYDAGFFDYVTMDQVIEHFADPVEALRGVHRVLRRGGAAILSTPNAAGWGARRYGRHWINWHVPYHLHQFSRRSLALAAEKAGFRLCRLRTLTHSEWLHYQRLHLANMPAPGMPSRFWAQGSPEVPPKVAALRRYRINHLVTRLCDTFGYGDSFLAFLEKP